MVKKNLVLMIVLLFIICTFIPIVTAQLTGINNTKLPRKSICIVEVEKQEAVVSIQQTWVEKGKSICLKTITLGDAEQVKEQLLRIEQNYVGIDKIIKQVQVLDNIEVVSSHLFFQQLLQFLLKKNMIHKSRLVVNNGFIGGGPLIVSHFIPGGYISGIAPLGRWYYNVTSKEINTLFNGMRINRTKAVLPLFFGVSFATTYITAVNFGSKSVNQIYCPFIEILIPAIGTGVRVIAWTNTNYSKILFEYNIDFCLVGFLAGIPIK